MDQIYGITGYKESGKDSFAKLVNDFDNAFTILRFADDLKRMTADIFHFPIEFMESQEEKARQFSIPVIMDNYIDAMSKATGLQIQPQNLVAHTLREILQYFGTDYVRVINDTYWIDRIMEKMNKLGSKILVTDLRFENESDIIHSLGGKVIKILRIDAKKSDDGHASETSIGKIVPDLTLGTVTGAFFLQNRVAGLLAENKFDDALEYDFSKLRVLAPLSHPNRSAWYSLVKYYGHTDNG